MGSESCSAGLSSGRSAPARGWGGGCGGVGADPPNTEVGECGAGVDLVRKHNVGVGLNAGGGGAGRRRAATDRERERESEGGNLNICHC